MSRTKPKFVVKHEGFFVSVLPVGFDTTDLVQVRDFGSRYVKYLNTVTGELIDCEVYAKQLEELLK